jgi:hypothetical protein
VSGTAGSVRFGIDGNSNFRTESAKPYALAGDTGNGDYAAWTPTVGTHTFTATLYSGSGGTGSVLDTETFTFTVTDGSGGGGGGGGTASFAEFELINADTNKDVSLFQDGSVIDFSKLGTKHVNVRADVNGSAGSVRFGIDGNANFRTENAKPYALAGDSAGDYLSWTPAVGTHTFTATLYSGANGTGSVLETKSFTFTVTSGGTTTPTGTGVKTFSLLNADTGAVIRTITEGSTIDFAALPTRRVAIRADVSGTVGSVRFGYDASTNFRTESKAPFAMNGDVGDGIHYTLWTPTDGSHTLTGTAYSGASATGSILGSPLTVHFTVINA